MPTISASPNPVGVYAPSTGQATTMVIWNTESAISGTVSVSENGGSEAPFGSGPSGGPLALPVTLGSTYRLSLKVPPGAGGGNTPVEVASAMVTTFDLRSQIAAGFSQAYVPQLRPQMITNLVVKPGIDTVYLSFRTTFPTIPTTELRDSAGNWVDGKLPLSGGLRKRHQVEFGFEEALALNHEHSFKIEAFAPQGANISPNKAVVEGKFITGRRHVDVMWETLDVLNDSDSGGAGEFNFTFGVGDVATGAALGSPESWIGDIQDSGPIIDLGLVQSLTDAHRLLWLQVIGDEDDDDWPSGITARGSKPEFKGAGGLYTDDGEIQRADLTIVVDVDRDPGRWMIPFELRTGQWPVDFVVTGHLGVHGFEGEFISTKIGKLGPPSQSSAFLPERGSTARLAVGGVGERTESVGIGGDGAFYHSSRRRQRAGTGGGSGWTRVELPGRGTPAVAAGGDTLDLIDLDARGGVMLCRFDPSRPKSARWRKLGGNFQHVVPALKFGKAKGAEPGLVLFGIADDGDLFVRDAHGDGTDWDRLGDHPVRAVAPVSAPGVGAALCAVGDSGVLLHFEQRGGRWRQQELARIPGDGKTQLLTTAFIEQTEGKGSKGRRRDLLIAAMSEEYRVRALLWPDYPAGSPETRWQDLGPVQDLLAEKKARTPKRRPPAKSK